MEVHETIDIKVNFTVSNIFMSHSLLYNVEPANVRCQTMTTSIIPKIRTKIEGTNILTKLWLLYYTGEILIGRNEFTSLEKTKWTVSLNFLNGCILNAKLIKYEHHPTTETESLL